VHSDRLALPVLNVAGPNDGAHFCYFYVRKKSREAFGLGPLGRPSQVLDRPRGAFGLAGLKS
jgi:hypothetical protein